MINIWFDILWDPCWNFAKETPCSNLHIPSKPEVGLWTHSIPRDHQKSPLEGKISSSESWTLSLGLWLVMANFLGSEAFDFRWFQGWRQKRILMCFQFFHKESISSTLRLAISPQFSHFPVIGFNTPAIWQLARFRMLKIFYFIPAGIFFHFMIECQLRL